MSVCMCMCLCVCVCVYILTAWLDRMSTQRLHVCVCVCMYVCVCVCVCVDHILCHRITPCPYHLSHPVSPLSCLLPPSDEHGEGEHMAPLISEKEYLDSQVSEYCADPDELSANKARSFFCESMPSHARLPHTFIHTHTHTHTHTPSLSLCYPLEVWISDFLCGTQSVTHFHSLHHSIHRSLAHTFTYTHTLSLSLTLIHHTYSLSPTRTHTHPVS
jgi:hypothetical protein